MGVVLGILIFAVIIWLCVVANKADQKLESEQRQQLYKKQMELWEAQARSGQRVTIQEDLKKDYGLDKLEQKEETKKIIKSAVAGGILAGDAGAIVGATIAKNKIDNERSRSAAESVNNSWPANTETQTRAPSPSEGRNEAASYESDDDVPSIIQYYRGTERDNTKSHLIQDKSWKTGDLLEEIRFCISQLKVVTLTDLCDILDGKIPSDVRPQITPLIRSGEVTRFLYKGRPMFAWKEAECEFPPTDTEIREAREAAAFNAKAAAREAAAINFYGSDEWETVKNSLIEKGITKSGNPYTDILFCLFHLKIASITDLGQIIQEDPLVIRKRLTHLMNNDQVKRIVHENRPLFLIVDENIFA